MYMYVYNSLDKLLRKSITTNMCLYMYTVHTQIDKWSDGWTDRQIDI